MEEPRGDGGVRLQSRFHWFRARPAALPFLVCLVMAAPETQGAAARGEEDCKSNHSESGSVSYEGEYCSTEP